ncbi:MAG: hypothetical protein K1Y02_22460 [Candidatus Hydrogenedentes bacterium]|nr:hypothetical protein [Candidatus Hydrogenedentota bacterium]
MAMATRLSTLGRIAREPFRIDGTALQPNVLLMAKLIVIGLVLKGYHNGFPNAFAPFFSIFDALPEPAFRRTLKAVFLVSATCLLFNRAVRIQCGIIGAVFLLGVLSSKVYYRNAIVFVSMIFLLTSLQERGRAPRLLYWQLGVMYLGAGLNKLCDPDWQTGQYFHYFLGSVFQSDIYLSLAPVFPGKSLAAAMCWWIIAAELCAGVLFFVPRRHDAAVWFAASVHVGAAFLVIGDYGIFMSAVLASYLCVVRWPDEMKVRFDRTTWMGNIARAYRWLDMNRAHAWQEQPGPLIWTAGARHAEGWKALLCIAIYSPSTYFVAMVLLTIRYEPWRVVAVRGAGIAGIVLLSVLLAQRVFTWKRLASST